MRKLLMALIMCLSVPAFFSSTAIAAPLPKGTILKITPGNTIGAPNSYPPLVPWVPVLVWLPYQHQMKIPFGLKIIAIGLTSRRARMVALSSASLRPPVGRRLMR